MYINSVNRSKLKVYHSGFTTLTAILFQPERHSFPTCQAISHLQAGEEDQVPAVIAEVRDTSIHCTVRRNIGLTAPGHGPQTQLRQGSSASGQHKHDRTEWDIHVRSRAFWFWCWAAHSTSLNNASFGSHTQLHCRNLPDIHVHCSPLKFSISGASVNQECKTAGWFNCSQSQMKLAAFGGMMPRLNQPVFIHLGVTIRGSISGLTSSVMLSSSTVPFPQQIHNPLPLSGGVVRIVVPHSDRTQSSVPVVGSV